MTTWYVDVTFTTARPADDDTFFDFTDELDGAPASISAEATAGSVGVTTDAPSVFEAIEAARRRVTDAARATIGTIEITGIEAMTIEKMRSDAEEAALPDVVGYAEIARIVGVSRQRVRQLALDGKLPHPVIETSQGPLFLKTAIEAWAANRNPTTGRPRHATTITA